VIRHKGLARILLFILRETVLLQQRHNLVTRPQVMIDFAVFGLSNCCELDWDDSLVRARLGTVNLLTLFTA
jgi:hypothetical protein